MKIKVVTKSEIGTLSSGKTLVDLQTKLVSLVSGPHNFKFDHAESNLLFFKASKFPTKEITARLTEKEKKEISITGAYVRACFRVQGNVDLCFIVRYSIKESVKRTGGGVLNCYTITEKEVKFAMEFEKAETIRLVEPYLLEFDAVNNGKTAQHIRDAFHEWAHPVTLESVITGLTEQQKREAAKILKAHFAA